MMEEALTNIGVVLLIGLAVYSVRAMIGIFGFYREEGGHRSVLWRTLIVIDVIAVVASVVLVVPALVALFGLPRLPLTGPIVVLALIALEVGVSIQWQVFKRIKSRRGMVTDVTGSSMEADE